MKKPHHKTSPQVALRIARAQLRAIRQYATPEVARQAKPGPPQFLQCWAVNRGFAGVTQALDSAGQVWERVSLMEEVLNEDGKKQKRLKESWWAPISMQRRALEATA